MSATAPTKGLQDVGPFAGYARDERPLDAYGALTAACGAALAGACGAALAGRCSSARGWVTSSSPAWPPRAGARR